MEYFDSPSVNPNELQVGETYTIYGCISDLDIQEEKVYFSLGNLISATSIVPEPASREIVKSRAFEPGMFVCRVYNRTPAGRVFVDCKTMVFGKQDKTMN